MIFDGSFFHFPLVDFIGLVFQAGVYHFQTRECLESVDVVVCLISFSTLFGQGFVHEADRGTFSTTS